ncbi:tetratricopeptide repeat protein [Marinagarivorans algicola]|uniref:tetratricopeptide repeat protein n=1 Tax=Marinagarivorans algicola TaxID=1513270 RepID=UPI00373571BE
MINRLVWLVFLGCLSVGTQAKKPPLSAVADLRYGVALYHFYQNQHFQALSDLLVAEKKGGIQGHGDNPEIMLGGFYLAYGLDRTASDIFERLLDVNRPQKTRDAAWFYLAKIRYLRDDIEGVKDALARISDKPQASIAHELQALMINLAIKDGELDKASRLIAKVDDNEALAPYLYFNMAAAYARAQDYPLAISYYEKLAKIPQREEEYLALYDKAMTAAGYAYFFNKQHDQAIEQFKRVRLDSPMSGRALLGYGWASVDDGEYRSALAPWQLLAQDPLIDENTQEALVAIPYAYEQMGLAKVALDKYRDAEASFESEIVTLDTFVNDLNSEAMLDALKIDPSEDINWFNYAQKNKLAPQLSYLTALFARNEFQGLVQELRDLLVLQRKLTVWQGRMQFYLDMLDEREANRLLEMNVIAQQEAFENLNKMQSDRRSLLATLNRFDQTDDFLSMLQGKERERLARIKQAEGNLLMLLDAGHDMALEREKLARLRGLLLWNAGELFAERIWRGRKTLEELSQRIDGAVEAQVRIQTIVDEGFDLAPYRTQINEAKQRITRQQANLKVAIEEAQSILRTEVIAALAQQRSRLQYYLAQSRLAIARISDEADGERY